MRDSRNRYVVFDVYSEAQDVQEREIKNALFNTARSLYGEAGAVNLEFQMIEFDPSKRQGILRCNHKSITETRATMAAVTSLQEKPACLRVIGISGTLRRARRKYLNRTTKEVDKNRDPLIY